jgi:hypothetical protein
MLREPNTNAIERQVRPHGLSRSRLPEFDVEDQDDEQGGERA